jgi:hypothetical protein
MNYYDIVLGLIPLALSSIASVLILWGVTPTTAVALGSASAAGLVGHAMFIRTPTDEPVGSTPSAHAADVSPPHAD